MRYVSNGDWFDKGTEAKMLQDEPDECGCAVFSGLRNGVEEEEYCPLDEFDVEEDNL